MSSNLPCAIVPPRYPAKLCRGLQIGKQHPMSRDTEELCRVVKSDLGSLGLPNQRQQIANWLSTRQPQGQRLPPERESTDGLAGPPGGGVLGGLSRKAG